MDVRIRMIIVCPLMPINEVPKLVRSADVQFNRNTPGTITRLLQGMRTAIPTVEIANQVNDVRPYYIGQCERHVCFVSPPRLDKAFINHPYQPLRVS